MIRQVRQTTVEILLGLSSHLEVEMWVGMRSVVSSCLLSQQENHLRALVPIVPVAQATLPSSGIVRADSIKASVLVLLYLQLCQLLWADQMDGLQHGPFWDVPGLGWQN